MNLVRLGEGLTFEELPSAVSMQARSVFVDPSSEGVKGVGLVAHLRQAGFHLDQVECADRTGMPDVQVTIHRDLAAVHMAELGFPAAIVGVPTQEALAQAA